MLLLFTVYVFKGLGTSTNAEGREYFSALNQHCKTFYFDENSDDAIDKVFCKERADDRKNWLRTVFDANVFLNPNENRVSISDFIDKEFIHFSHADNIRCEKDAMRQIFPVVLWQFM